MPEEKNIMTEAAEKEAEVKAEKEPKAKAEKKDKAKLNNSPNKKLKVLYKGPGSFVNVAPYGKHNKDEVKGYPAKFALDLIKTSKKQKFEIVK